MDNPETQPDGRYCPSPDLASVRTNLHRDSDLGRTPVTAAMTNVYLDEALLSGSKTAFSEIRFIVAHS